jgi:phage terminase small subunit
MTDKLTPKQEYLVDLNASQAAIRAGYSARTAGAVGFENLKKPEIARRVDAARAERAERTKITADRVLQELARIAFFDPRRLLNSDGSPKPVHELDDDTAAALAGMDILEEFEGTGEDRKFVGYTKKFKIADKNTALTNAMRHLGMMKDKLEVETTIVGMAALMRQRKAQG